MSKKIIIVDSSTLIALERGELINYLDKINLEIVIGKDVLNEIGDLKKSFTNYRIENLNGKTKGFSENIEKLGIGKGEAECIAILTKLNQKLIICDDVKLTRQLFLFKNDKLNDLRINGFSFFLDIFCKKGLITDVWPYFNKIIGECNWERSEVLALNFAFLKRLGY